MTLQEWTAEVMAELKAAGFEVSEYQRFPFVKAPTSMQEGVRLLKFTTSLAADRTLYAEGMLFVPAGSAREAERLKKLGTASGTTAER
jgi:hypothetical protein